MASRYDDLDASLELEQRVAADLKAAFEPRGCEVVHLGTSGGQRHSPGGKPDIEIRDPANKRLILVEVTKRKGSAADGEFGSVTAHLNSAVAKREFESYGLLYVSPATSARMSTNFRDLYNRNKERAGESGRVVALDFEAMELMLDTLTQADPKLYESSRLGELFDRWEEAVDDARARQLVQSTIFPEDRKLAIELAEEAQEFDALRERELKRSLERVEDKFRSHGITGNNANVSLVYLAFLRLFEERSQRKTGKPSRFTLDGFQKWRQNLPNSVIEEWDNHQAEFLLREISREKSLKEADLLQSNDGRRFLHQKLTDTLVEELILPVFDEYDFHAGRVDILGAVFETLARRGEKDTRVGQFFTPQQVVDFCTDLVDLSPRDKVLDPASGTGRFLIAAMDRMLEKSDEDIDPRGKVADSIRRNQLLGSDIDEWVATITKMNMFIHGDGKSGILTSNGLALGHFPLFPRWKEGVNGKIDVILTNPPLGETDYSVAHSSWEMLSRRHDDTGHNPSEGEASYYEWLGVVPLETAEESQLTSLQQKYATLQAAIDSSSQNDALNAKEKSALTRNIKKLQDVSVRIAELRTRITQGHITRSPRGRSMKGGALFLGAIAQYLTHCRNDTERVEWAGGRTVLVVDEAVLNTPDYASTREFIREKFFVKAVVSLGRDAFKYLAHTDAKTSILYLIKKPHEGIRQKEPIFYAHAERVGHNAVGKWVGDELPKVQLYYQAFKREIIGAYNSRHLSEEEALKLCQELPGHSTSFIARPIGSDNGERLDYYQARFHQRQDELVAKHGTLIRFGDIFEVAPRISPPASRTGEYDFAVAMRTGVIAFKGRSSVSYSPKDLWAVQAGDLVLSSIDLVNGAVAVAGDNVQGLVMSKEMYSYRLRAHVEAVPEYIQVLLRTKAAQDMLFGFATGTSNRTRLESASKLLDFPLPPLPSLEEQQKKASDLRSAYAMQADAVSKLESLRLEAQESWGQSSDFAYPMDKLGEAPVVRAKSGE